MQDALIMHVDLDAFFASVEQRDFPELQGKPVVVGGKSKRSVVAAASYEARQYGLHSAMPMVEALRLCPQVIVASHRMSAYAAASRHFFQILSEFSPIVEGLSIDEAFVDISGTEKLLGAPLELALSLKKRVRDELQLVCSVGIAPSKFAAKIASDIDKPDGLVIIQPKRLLSFLHPLPISKLWGVGKVSQEKLRAMGLKNMGDVAAFPLEVLEAKLGQNFAHRLHSLANGIDPRKVDGIRQVASISHEETYSDDQWDREFLKNRLLEYSEKVAKRLRAKGLEAKTVGIKVKYGDFRQITRQQSLSSPSADGALLYKEACLLLEQVPIEAKGGKAKRVRLCGLGASNLVDSDAPKQLDFSRQDSLKGEAVGKTLDRISERFGEGLITRGNLAPPPSKKKT